MLGTIDGDGDSDEEEENRDGDDLPADNVTSISLSTFGGDGGTIGFMVQISDWVAVLKVKERSTKEETIGLHHHHYLHHYQCGHHPHIPCHRSSFLHCSSCSDPHIQR